MNSHSAIPTLCFDHVVVAIDCLDKSVERFISSGFHVEKGGVNGPTENALVIFEDGSYIELIALRSRLFQRLVKASGLIGLLDLFWKLKPTLKLRFIMWFAGKGGLIDWCLRSSDLGITKDHLEQSDVRVSEIGEFARTRPDGEIAEWLLASPLQRQHPFLIQDLSARPVRVPLVSSTAHRNGVVGIGAIIVNGNRYLNSQSEAGTFFTKGNTMVGRHNTITIELSGIDAEFELPADLGINIRPFDSSSQKPVR